MPIHNRPFRRVFCTGKHAQDVGMLTEAQKVEEMIARDPDDYKLPHLEYDRALELVTHPAVVSPA
jgi:hypothetical protein